MTLQQQKAENKDRATKEEEEEEDSELDEADLLDEIDNDPELTGYREQRLKELKEEADRAKILRDSDRGRYTELQSEKEVLKVTTSEKRCIVHFFHQEFRRCKIMDKHLDILAKSHIETRFCRVDVQKAPFLVERLKVQVLPCVVGFVDGITVDRLVGFEELGHNDSFSTEALEHLLGRNDVLTVKKTPVQVSSGRKTIFGGTGKHRSGPDDDEDWDEYE
ncbi:MAG: thioredoxin-like protein [Piptocephalis tieghemiana]|nr:MAG: thioredoxin-like protein [Piptocephalis tieghemiana]